MVILNSNGMNDMANISRGNHPLVRGGGRNVGNKGRILTPIPDGRISRAELLVRLNAAFSQHCNRRIATTEAFGASQRVSTVGVVRPTGRATITEVTNQSELDLPMNDPANLSFEEFGQIFLSSVPAPGFKLMIKMVVKYSLNIYNFPPCPEEDLMLAVFFFFEEKFNVKCKMVKCTKYEVRRNKQGVREQVGVIFDRVQAVEEILRRADIVLKDSAIKVKPNTNPELFKLATSSTVGRPTV